MKRTQGLPDVSSADPRAEVLRKVGADAPTPP
jgi:hypothetical protein